MWQFSLLILFTPFFVWTAFFNEPPTRKNQDLLIRVEQGFEFRDLQSELEGQLSLKVNKVKVLSEPLGIYALGFKHNPEVSIHHIQNLKSVKYVQWDGPVEFRRLPNDPEYDQQWGLEMIKAPDAWEVTTGGLTANGDEIVVAILDDGFDINHEDLNANLWSNRADKPNDNVDNDGNGFVDDRYGWDFDDNTGKLPISPHGHSVSGIIGAAGNNGVGVSGVNWNIKLMLLKTTTVSGIVGAYNYVIDQRKRYNETQGREGAFIVATNASFGQSNTFCEEQMVWGSMYDELGKVGVLTGAGTVNSSVDVEARGDMPTTCTSEFLITTLNINASGQKHTSSGFGALSIDLGSPGENSYTTKPFDRYGSFGGNSAAAPHLTGAIALLYSLPCQPLADAALSAPEQTALQIRSVILRGAEPQFGLTNITLTGGSLNVWNSIELLSDFCSRTSGELSILKVFPNPTTNLLQFEYETPDFNNYQLRIFNMLGQVVYQEEIFPSRFGKKFYRKEMSNYAPGTYILQLSREDQVVHSKFVLSPTN